MSRPLADAVATLRAFCDFAELHQGPVTLERARRAVAALEDDLETRRLAAVRIVRYFLQSKPPSDAEAMALMLTLMQSEVDQAERRRGADAKKTAFATFRLSPRDVAWIGAERSQDRPNYRRIAAYLLLRAGACGEAPHAAEVFDERHGRMRKGAARTAHFDLRELTKQLAHAERGREMRNERRRTKG